MAYYKCGSVYTTQNSNTVIDTASGAIANFETPFAMPLLDAQIDVNAVQDLHGQSGAYPAGGGINRWDEEWELGAWSSVTGDVVNYTDRIRCKNAIPVLPNTSYCIRFGTTASSVVNAYDENGDFIENLTTGTFGTGGRVITTPATCSFIKFSVGTAYGTAYKNDISVNYPSTNTAYHPYSNICPIDGWDEISAVSCGKNLFDYDESKVSTGETTLSNIRAFYPLGFKGVTSLTFSASLKSGSSITQSDYLNIGRLRKSDGLLEILSAFITPSGITTRTLSISSDDEVVLMSLENPTVIKSILSRYDVQIEVGSQATTYESYNGSTTVINLNNTYYGGRFIQDKSGKRKFEVTHKSLDWANTNFGRSNNSGIWDSYLFYAPLNDIDVTNRQLVSDYYMYAIMDIKHAQNFTCYVNASKYLYICNDDYDNVQDFKNAMVNHQLLYVLETPYTIDLPDGTPFKSLPGVNNIFADTGDISASYIKLAT